MKRSEVREILMGTARELTKVSRVEVRDRRTGGVAVEVPEEAILGMVLALNASDAILSPKADPEKVSGPLALTNILMEGYAFATLGDEEESDG